MKKLKYVLLDATPIIKLFELNLWGSFIDRCEVTLTRTVLDESKWASRDIEDVRIDLDEYEASGKIQVIELTPKECESFFNKFNQNYKQIIDPGEKESLAFLELSEETWKICSGDRAVYRILGLLNRSEQGISLEELLSQIGLRRSLENQFTKKFREQAAKLGEIDYLQGQGLEKLD